MPERNLEDRKDGVASGENRRLAGRGKSTPKAHRQETNNVLGVDQYCCRLEWDWWGSPCGERGVAAEESNGGTSS